MKNFTSLIFFFIATIISAQTSDIKQLKNELNYLEGKEKCDKYHDISAFYFEKNWDSVHHYASLQLDLANRIQYDYGKTQALVDLGNVYDIKGDFSKSKHAYDKALNISNSKFPDKIGSIYYGLGNLYYYTKNLDSAIMYYNKAISFKENENKIDYESIASIKLNLAIVYNHLGDYKKALNVLYQTKHYFERMKNEKRLSTVNASIGNTHFFLKNYDDAQKYYKKSLKIAENINDTILIATSQLSLGNLYGVKQKKDSALVMFNLAKKNFLNAGMSNANYTNINLMSLYSDSKQFMEVLAIVDEMKTNWDRLNPIEKSVTFYREAMAKKNLNSKSNIVPLLDSCISYINKYNLQSEMYYVYGYSTSIFLLDNATNEKYTQFMLYDSIRSDVLSKENKQIVFDLDKKYQTAEKEAKIAEQELINQKQKSYTYMALGGVFFILMLGGGTTIYRKQRERQQALQKEKELNDLHQNMTKLGLSNLNNQINSHDFKNTLTAALNEVQEKAPESYEHIHNLLKITESALYSDSFTDSLRNQLIQVEGLVKLSKKQLFENIDLKIKNQIDDSIELPRLLLKNLVENSLKHGIKGTGKDAVIEVNTSKSNDYIELQVKDNGKGLINKPLNKGKGISVYKQLFNFFNHKNQLPASLELKPIEHGTLALVRIPINYEFD